jgi:molybdenum cofactor synthesis domain-containing protein
MRPIRVGILTVSDRCSRGEMRDESGPALAKMARELLGAEIVAAACIPDEVVQIASTFRNWSRPGLELDLILSTGGTGLSPRDVTPEAALAVIERQHAGLMELARMRCMQKTPPTTRAYLSRGIAGTVGRTLIITLPGSVRGATENLDALLDILPHAIDTLRGDVQDDGRLPSPTPAGAVPTRRIIAHEN